MSHILKFYCKIFIFLLLSLITFQAQATKEETVPSQLTPMQQDFLRAYQAIKQNNRESIAYYKQKLQNYPLFPYLDFLDFIRHFETTPKQNILTFIHQNKNNHLSHRLKYKWLLWLGKQKQWQTFNQHYSAKEFNSKTLRCLNLQANYQLHKNSSIQTEDTIVAMQKFWLTGKPLSKTCRPIAKILLKKHRITGVMIWNNIILAMQKRQINYAKHLSHLLSKKERKIFQAWLKIDKNPKLLAKGLSKKIPLRIQRAIVYSSLKRLSRQDVKLAHQWLKKFQKTLPLTPKETRELSQYIALKFAYHLPEEAKDALYEVNQSNASQTTLRWQLQIALKYSDWPSVLDTYQLIDEHKQQTPKWQYWYAKALSKTGHPKQAKAIFKKLAKQRNFYGFLSADILDLPYHFNPAPKYQINYQPLIKKYAQLQRIPELLAIDWMLNANREWAYLLKHVNPNELQAINYLAHHWKQHNMAIIGAAKNKDWDNIEIRFPTPHKAPVMSSSTQNKIDPAWIYGIMRRESAFSREIRSPVGATGLMQLMPKTAKFIGRKIGVSRHIYQDLTSASSNIQLGSAYLSYLYQKYNNNQIIATAAYNAGPKRVDSWLPASPLPADQWVDSIPFTETRKYVKAVSEYTIIFQSLLNKKYHHLSRYMLPVQKPIKPSEKIK